MLANDLREWIDDLEERNDLKRIKAEVDWDEEIGAITREISSQHGPALFFESIKDHRQTLCRRLFTNGTGSKREGLPDTRGARKNFLPRAGVHLQRSILQTG